MIVGIVALFTMLFFGGAQESFFIEKLEKGVKKYVAEKDRSKEILGDLKLTKSMINAFNKERKGELSEFHTMNLDRNISRQAMDEFFTARVEERSIFQEKMIEKRLLVASKIEDNEWKEIIHLSDASVESKMAKFEKKGAEDPFEGIMKAINSSISEQVAKAEAISLAHNFKERYVKLLDQVNSFNTLESSLLKNKYSSAHEFQNLADEMNRLRETVYQAFIDLHFDMKEITNETEFVKVMKSINKVTN